MAETIWEKTFKVLKNNGIEVYPPATKEGECKSNYVVIKSDGSSQISTFSSQTNYYSIMMYVPKAKYSQLDRFANEVTEIIASKLYPDLMPTGQETPDFYDDTVKAHMRSIMYRVNKRNEHL